MRISNVNYLTFKSQDKIDNSRLDFSKNYDLKQDEITILDDKIAIGRALGKPQYSHNGDPNNYTFDFYTLLRDVEFLHQHNNVNTIIDLRNPEYEGNQFAQAEKVACEKKGVNYYNIPLDSGSAPTKEEVETFFDIINNSEGRVYIHCHAGRDRTGIMSSCYLAKTYNKTQKEAFEEVFEKRNITPLKFMYGQPDECKKLADLLINLSQEK